MEKPLVSVIIPTYNREIYLDKAINSVTKQTYKNIEIIIVDDGSSFEYAKEICNKYSNCKYFYKENGGLSSARNFGVEKSNGELIAFLDDDDLFLPTKIEKQVKILNENKNIFCVHSSVQVIDENDNLKNIIYGASKGKEKKRSGYVFWNALGTWVVKSPTPLIRKEVFQNLKFDEKIMVGEDIDFYQRLFFFYKIYYINEPLALYRIDNNIDRLSNKKDKYLGVEIKLFKNLIKNKMNFVTKYFIALKLAKTHLKRCEDLNLLKISKVEKIKLILNPFIYLKYKNFNESI